MKTMATKRRKLCDLVWISKMEDDDDGDDVLGAAMQIWIRNHPPRAHKGSISMNRNQGLKIRRGRETKRKVRETEKKERERERRFSKSEYWKGGFEIRYTFVYSWEPKN